MCVCVYVYIYAYMHDMCVVCTSPTGILPADPPPVFPLSGEAEGDLRTGEEAEEEERRELEERKGRDIREEYERTQMGD